MRGVGGLLLDTKKKARHREYMKNRYRSDPEFRKRRIALVRASDAKKKRELTDLVNRMKSIPCKDCGGMFPPCVMDFDHVSGKKSQNISVMLFNRSSKKALLEELAKCEPICANCHRMRTCCRAGRKCSLTFRHLVLASS